MNDLSLRQRLRMRLIGRADKTRQNFTILLAGAGLFMLGFLLLGGAEYLLNSSLLQELIALLGLILAIGGAVLAAFGYISLSVLWLYRFIYADNNRNHDSTNHSTSNSINNSNRINDAK